MSKEAENFVAALVASGDAQYLVRHPEIGEYMSHGQQDASLFAFVDDHLKAHGKLPALETVQEYWGALPKPVEPPSFYLDQLRPMHVRRTLQAAAVEAQTHMLGNPEKSLETLMKAVHRLVAQRQGLSIMELKDAKDFMLKHLSSKWAGQGFYQLGWPSYDNVSGGIQSGDVIVMVGKSGLGKTMLLLSRAYHLWKTYGIRVLFVSMEMSMPVIMERAVAIHASIPMDYMKHGVLPNLKIDFKKQMIDRLDAIKDSKGGFFFVDGNIAVTNDDLLRLCSQLQPDVVVVDGAYLMGGSGYQKRHETIAEGFLFRKSTIATRMGIPVVESHQFTTEAAKEHGKKAYSPQLQDIGGSKEIGNGATTVMGLFQGDTPETILKRKVQLLKGRNGEVGQWPVEWDFWKMNFDEITEPEPEMLEIT